MSLIILKRDVRKISSPKKAKTNEWFFKTGPGEYGEGDTFIGLTMPDSRSIAKKHIELSLGEITRLLRSPIHEERTIALLLLIHKFKEGTPLDKKKIYALYLKNTKYINNWDLVDITADKIVGEYVSGTHARILYRLAKSKNLWERRIAIIATFYFIKQNSFHHTLAISGILLHDTHDLIQKAVGWMLREVGKRSQSTEEKFLKKHYKKMPRTMLRYAIERFPKNKRQIYMKRVR